MKNFGKRLEKIRQSIGKEVIFTIGMRKEGKVDIISVRAADYVEDNETLSADYIG
ncbi:MAG: hypothetical protein NT001_01085 [Candidatus Woesearchaeota archaeon]|nr:hypothetical protein [Candidatus Woesearchaeota archaeon]